ncbi:HlyD family type I secretion periplasmic adaptor subunit [Porticoccaceae bacterium LTM1]|nr:HlyD family type I secretion periplasmic adaptor subunit [Porticoccaceae bacterium LTM1]
MIDLNKLRRHLGNADTTDLKYMSYSSEAVLQQSPVLSRMLLWLVALFIVVMIVWASLAEVDEFTRGEGKIVPSSDIQVVGNLEGGILVSLMASEGELVERDQPLLQIDDTLFASSAREQQIQMHQLQAKVARLRAEATRSSLDDELSKIKSGLPGNVVTEERGLFDARDRGYKAKLNSLQQKVTQKQQELSSIKVEKDHLSKSYELALRELNINRPMVKDGAVSEVELLRLEREVNDLKSRVEQAELAIPQLQAALQESKQNVESFKEEYIGTVREELTDTLSELQRLEETHGALEDKVRRRTVRSPVRGTVKQLNVKTIGGVIQPGMDIVEIVPIEDSLLVDAKVLPADIAFIHPGQNAAVKFTAYDYSIHGGLDAEVVQISPDTIVDEEGVSYYEVRLQTTGRFIGAQDKELDIIPGMTVHVDILTGKKTIMDYLLKPILKTKQLAFRER